MSANWIVRLIKAPTSYTYRAGFFPRAYHYKKDAVEMVKEVQRVGGQATIEKLVKGGK